MSNLLSGDGNPQSNGQAKIKSVKSAKGVSIALPKYNDESSDDDIPLAKRATQPKRPFSKKPVPSNDSGSDDEIPLSQRVRVKTPKNKDSSSDDDVPLAKRTVAPKKSTAIKKEESDDDVPLAKKKAISTSTKKATSSIKRAKSEPMDVDVKPKKRPAETQTPKREKKVKTEKPEEEIYKWWEEESQQEELVSDGTVKWATLEHSGVLFPPDYVPHGVKMLYDGKPISLTPEAEEVASFFAALLETDHGVNPVFQKNFFEDWQEVLAKDPKNPKITDFAKCDFRPIWKKFEQDKEQKKLLTKEEKLKIKNDRLKAEEKYIYALIDGRKEKVGNFRIEPPGLFRGRGNHPKTGKLKKRVMPDQVTLNIGAEAKAPEAPAGHSWAPVVHDQTATWLATWKENVNGSIKYVFLAATSTWKGQSDMQKFEKARELKNHVGHIRSNYTHELKAKLSEVRQRATAMYLIDKLALRAGNEKGEDEADTVGCCSLRYEHIELESENILKFDFLGKDSIRYQNTVKVDEQVCKNIKIFKNQVGPGHMIFDRLTTTGLNKYLNSCMKGLSAKVFRTYNASITFQEQVDKLTNPNDSIADKLLSYNRANRMVAVLCNHQRAASKTHDQTIAKITDSVRALKLQRMKLRKQLYFVDPKSKKKPEFADPESDLEDEWIQEYEKVLIEKEKEKIKSKFEKANEVLASEKKPRMPPSELKEKIKAANELAARFKKERQLAKIEPKNTSMTAEKLMASIRKMDERIQATKTKALDKEENKEIALGTSKLNYIDPRITVSWCRNNDVPLEKVFSKTLLEKFRWAQKIPKNWKF